MHTDQLHIGEATVRRLIDEQFPQWRDAPVQSLQTDATVNAIFRVGLGHSARFPLQGNDPASVQAELYRESAASRELVDHSSVPTPVPVAIGTPGRGYPLPWSVQTWIPGQVASPAGAADSADLARDLGVLINGLRSVDTRGRRFAGGGRGGILTDQDDWMETCLRNSAGLVDVPGLRQLWAELRTTPAGAVDVMSHRDLIPPNLLIDNGRLTGVLDGGGFGPADPALDLIAGWHLLDADRRLILRETLGSDDREWQRGKGWAFAQAMGLAWYYRESNPGMSALGRSTLTRLLDAR